jgi:peptidyl-prolyl cis-trans isomerase SurA
MARALAAVLFGLMMVLGGVAPAAAAVKATVNGQQITDVQVSQRLKLFALEGRSGAKAALEELINEALMLQEAKRLNIEISDKQVDDAFLGVARNIKVSSDKLRQILGQNGVNVDTLRDRLRAALAWNSITQNVIMARVQISDVELEQKAEAKLDPSMSYDYILKEVLFVRRAARAPRAARRRPTSTRGASTAATAPCSCRSATPTPR